MRILTNKQYDALIDSVKLTAYADGKRDGYLEGHKVGKDVGYHNGLIEDKTGIIFSSIGMYIFKDGVTTVTNTNPVKQEEISAYFK